MTESDTINDTNETPLLSTEAASKKGQVQINGFTAYGGIKLEGETDYTDYTNPNVKYSWNRITGFYIFSIFYDKLFLILILILLEGIKKWYNEYCKDFRHSLAHRIPLYVPKGVHNQNIERYQQIPAKGLYAIKNRDYEKANKLDKEERSLMMNLSVYTHSFAENPGLVPYHIQLIADFNTIIEFADKFFEEF